MLRVAYRKAGTVCWKIPLAGTLSIDRAHVELASRRKRVFQAKWRFNRALRSLVSSPASVTAAAVTATVLPSMFAQMIRYAGDCPADVESTRE